MSDDDVEWFCAECEFNGSKDEVKEHAKRFQHKYGAGDYLYMADFKVTSVGVSACPLPEGMEMIWVHANFCSREGCPNPVLEDEEVRDHIRMHLAKGELRRNAQVPSLMSGITSGTGRTAAAQAPR